MTPRPATFEQKRVRLHVQAGQTLPAIAEAAIQIGKYAREGFRLYAVELIFERAVPVTAGPRVRSIPPSTPGGTT